MNTPNNKRKKEPLKVVVVNPPTKEQAEQKIKEINKFLNEKYNRNWNENKTTKK